MTSPDPGQAANRRAAANAKRSAKVRGSSNPNVRWTDAEVRTMRELYLYHRVPSTEIARRFNTYDSNVLRILRWDRWSHTDLDLRGLPRPLLKGGRPPLSEEERKLKRKLAAQRYYERRNQKRRLEAKERRERRCSQCRHYDAQNVDCLLGYVGVLTSQGACASICEQYSLPDSASSSISSS